MNTFRWVFAEVYVIGFNFIIMRFKVKVTFFPIKFYKNNYFHRKFITGFCYFCFTLTYVPLDQ